MTTTNQEAQHIVNKLGDYFTEGIRVLFLIHRNKEGGKTNNTKIQKVITTCREEYENELAKLLLEKDMAAIAGKQLRVYASANARHVNTAIREFKQQQLNADYYDEESRNGFYYSIRDRFISALMKPSSRDQSNFILDIDREEKEDIEKKIIEHGIEKIITYKTKNGWHIVTKPFNPALLGGIEDLSVHKDGLLLISY